MHSAAVFLSLHGGEDCGETFFQKNCAVSFRRKNKTAVRESDPLAAANVMKNVRERISDPSAFLSLQRFLPCLRQ